MAHLSRKKITGLLLCLTALLLVAAGWAWHRGRAPSTDNAYVRGDITSLAPKVSGYVVAVEVEDNEAVRPGDVLFRIDDADYRARLAQAEANVAAAGARLANIEAETRLQHTVIRQAMAQRRASAADLDLAAKASERRRTLIQSSAVSQAQVDESDAARLRADAGLSGASASLQAQREKIGVLATQRDAAIAAIGQAQAARELARIDLASTVVRAPVEGVIGNRQVRVGRFVTPGVSLMDIVPIGHLWVVANFKETALETIRPGQRATITIDGFPNARFEGVVDSYAPGSGAAFSLIPPDNATGNFVRVVQRVPVKLRLARHPLTGRLVPGLSARVEISRARAS